MMVKMSKLEEEEGCESLLSSRTERDTIES
jgi:hypothetical protein